MGREGEAEAGRVRVVEAAEDVGDASAVAAHDRGRLDAVEPVDQLGLFKVQAHHIRPLFTLSPLAPVQVQSIRR